MNFMKEGLVKDSGPEIRERRVQNPGYAIYELCDISFHLCNRLSTL